MTEFERGVLLAQDDCRALHPRAGLEADQHVFRHRILPAMNWIAAAWHEAGAGLNTNRLRPARRRAMGPERIPIRRLSRGRRRSGIQTDCDNRTQMQWVILKPVTTC